MAQRMGGPGITNFAIKIEPQVVGADKASAQLNRLVDKGVAAVEAGNLELAQKYEQAIGQIIGKKGKAEIQVDVDTVVDKDGVKHLQKTSRIHTENISKLSKQKSLHHGSLTSLRAQLRTATQNRDAIAATTTVTGVFGRKVQVANAHWVEANNQVKNLSKEINLISQHGSNKGFMSGFLSVGNKLSQITMSAMALGQAIQAVNMMIGPLVNRQKEIQSLKLSFEQLGVSVEGQNAILRAAKAVSLTYGQSLTKIEGAFKRLGPAIMAAGGSLTDTQLVIETIAARTTMLGLNTEKTGRYIEAFAQVMGKGRLQGEELNQQFAELDGALRGQLASYFKAKYGIENLSDAMQNSEITSQMFMEAMIAIGEVAREKVAGDFALLQKSIESLGKKGGMTIAQFQAKMQTLTAIGLEKVGQTLAPIGKALASVYAAFVQIFTKVATEMPGVQMQFQWMANFFGKTLKFALNGILLLFGVIMQVVNQSVLYLRDFIDEVMKLPVIGDIFRAISDKAKKLEEDLDYAIDGFSMLSEETTGSMNALQNFENKAKDLDTRLAEGKITQDQYNEAISALDTKKAQAELRGLEAQAESTTAKLRAYVEAYEAASEKKIAGWEDDIKAIEEVSKADKKSVDGQVEGIKRAAEARKRGYEDSKAAAKAYHDGIQAALDKEADSVKRNKELLRRYFEDSKTSVKEYYDELRRNSDEAHAQAMSNYEAEIKAINRKRDAELQALENGPEKRKLTRMEIRQLRRKAAKTTDPYERQKIRAQIEQIENEEKAHRLKIEHAKELAEVEKQKAEADKKRAEEKKKIDEEERERLKKLQEEQQQAFRDIADALYQIAQEKRQSQEQEKQALKEIDDAKRKDERDTKDGIQSIQDAHDKREQSRKDQIDRIKEKIDEEKDKLKEITDAIEANERAMGEFGDAVEDVTLEELQSMLEKLQAIERQIKRNKAAMAGKGDDTPEPPRQTFAGGPVRGGELLTVNEIGREGFITSSGKMSEIATKAWGTWRAPSNGTVIPAHIWSEIKAAQNMDPASINVAPFSGGHSVSSISHGDSIMNNVTVQSVNPAKTASDMLVSMTKIRRRRLR